MTQNTTLKVALNKTQRRRVEALGVARTVLANSAGIFATTNDRPVDELVDLSEYILGGMQPKPAPDADPHIHVSTDQGSYAGPASLMAVHAPTVKAVA